MLGRAIWFTRTISHIWGFFVKPQEVTIANEGKFHGDT